MKLNRHNEYFAGIAGRHGDGFSIVKALTTVRLYFKQILNKNNMKRWQK